uniref:Uncharacterized protein n=1 Tax=Salix viminalis TaxID=40686 RepID=A0A6N2KFF8_SALVM
MITSIKVFCELNPLEMPSVLKCNSVYCVGFVLNPMLLDIENEYFRIFFSTLGRTSKLSFS